jgi:hypothetical protein
VRACFLVLAACTLALPAVAAEPVGCDKFKWPLDKERATLTGTDLPKVASGGRMNWPLPVATMITLVPFAEAKLPFAPERAPKSDDSFAGFVEVSAPAKAGIYKVTLSSDGWMDVIQGGRPVRSVAFTGATGCTGVRKSLKFELTSAPFIVQLSGIEANTIGIAISGE